MKKANYSDKDKVVKIICESFDKNPHINYIIKNDDRRNRRMIALAEYAFEFGIRRDGVHLTDDGLGVAIIFKHKQFKVNIYEYWLQLRLAIKAFTLFRTLKINNLETLIKRNRAKNTDFLYLWFFGVADEALGTNNARELMQHVFKLSKDLSYPIYCETSLKRNSKIYKRFGFKNYNVLNTGVAGLTFWYMKRSA